MQRIWISTLPIALGALVACGGQDDAANETATNVQAVPEDNLLNDAIAGNEAAPIEVPETTQPETAPMATRQIPPPAGKPKAPKTAPRQPLVAEPDPHAGHDMGNMANIQ